MWIKHGMECATTYSELQETDGRSGLGQGVAVAEQFRHFVQTASQST